MAVDVPADSGYEGIQIDEFIIGHRDNFMALLAEQDYAGLAEMMKNSPAEALKHWDEMKSFDQKINVNLTPFFTEAAHYILSDTDIKSRLEFKTILPRAMKDFNSRADAIMKDADKKFEAMLKAYQKPLNYGHYPR